MEKFIPLYDLESLTEPQRQDYIKAVCKHMGVPEELNLVSLTYIDETDGPSRLVAYAKRGATENVRNALEIDIIGLTHEMVGGSIVFTATAKSKKSGRHEIGTGSKYIKDLMGTPLDDAIMTASTRALRRATLQFVGAGVLDESEINQRRTVVTKSTTTTAIPQQPVVVPNNQPGKDITPEIVKAGLEMAERGREQLKTLIDEAKKESQEEFEARMVKLRADAIEQLNAAQRQESGASETHDQPVIDIPGSTVKVPRKTRTRKAKVDLGPSELPASVAQAVVTLPTREEAKPLIEALKTPEPVVVKITQPVLSVRSKLTHEQVKPFRQRLFKIVNELELNGFAPKEGMGNHGKMRNLATIMFSDIADLNDLTVEQWEKYLHVLEQKTKTDGPAATVKYIEESIGI